MQQIKFRQVAFIYCIGTFCFSAFLLPQAVSIYAGNAALLVPLFSIGFSLLFAYILYTAVRQYGSLKHMVALHFGKKGVKVCAFILLIWLAFLAVFYLGAFYDRLACTAFSFVPRTVCIGAAVLCALLFAFSHFRVIARSMAVVFIIMLCTVALLVAFCAQGVKPQLLLPVKVNSFTLFLRAFLFPVGNAGLLTFFLFFFELPDGKLLSFGASLAGGNLIMGAVIFLTQAVFGRMLSENLSYPFFALIKSTDSLVKLEHLESLISGIWIIMSLSFFIALLRVCVCALRALTCDMVVPRRFPLLVLALFFGVFLVSAVLPQNRFLSEFVLSTVMPLGNILLGIVPICILTLTNKKL